ncbi:MAG: ABC transporter ATP-binding protein [Thaumarchaeota archaeon]|nr:ABC transporter ATP-binding protein [Nitrososphaerota archaeon]
MQEAGEGSSAVDVKDLRREYVTRSFLKKTTKVTAALDGISLRVARGELFGLIGPNGAGKTTTIKILTTLLSPTSGSAKILDLDINKDMYEIRRRIGIVFGGERGLYNRVTAVENLKYFADLYGVPPSEITGRVKKMIEMVGLEGRENERVEKYSRGMKQRLHIAKALIHDPELVFLDEPTIGLDPGGARDIRNMVRGMKKDGKSIFLTTHNMFEADELCDRVAVISRGKIVALDTPAGLKKSAKDISVIELQTYGADANFVQRIEKIGGVTRVVADLDSERQSIRVQTEFPTEVLPTIVGLAGDVNIIDKSIREPTLEDAYLRLVEE